MGMISALGQLGQPQDYGRAVSLIRFAADFADDNAPQGAYVSQLHELLDLPIGLIDALHRFTACCWPATCLKSESQTRFLLSI